ncbi:nonribosomal peptide synthase [Trichoderma arundinaceum]|uniref:Nonribosomal peptide synthase n=1 Tax=Trichoderma arundinaceum TaxID=490622 RepID=A0A395NU88_TRIAR|nr:nonribosomal peptide synthase [Trichoderma arundinaceum]
MATSEDYYGKSLFNTAISFQKDDASSGQAHLSKSIALERVWSKDPTEYDIVLGVADRSDTLIVSLYFYNGRIPESQASNIANVLSHVVASIVDDPKDTVEDVLARDYS